MNLIEKIQKEIERNKGLLKKYKILPQGWMFEAIVNKRINMSEKAITIGNETEMLRCYNELQQSK